MFQYDEEVSDRFPGLHAGIVTAAGVDNASPCEALSEEFKQQQRVSLERIGDTPVGSIPSIAAWRRVFSSLGVKPTRHRVAVEALMRRLDKAGDIPNISPLVDLGNLVSIRHGVPVAVFDVARVEAPIRVCFASGTEQFADIGSDTMVSPDPGEVVFVDAAGAVCARRWCWRQSSQSATSADTTSALFVIEAHHDSADTDIDQAIGDVEALLTRHQPTADVQALRHRPGSAPATDHPPEAA